MNTHFFSCDWGTSNFRLRLVSHADLRVVEEFSSEKGVGVLVKAWGEKGVENEEARIRFYTDVLRDGVEKLKAHMGSPLKDVPVIISGMASSTIGLVNLPYQSLPIPTDGSGLKTRFFEPSGEFQHSILLISGLCSNDDVMRGEETQLIGCMTPEMEAYQGEQLIIHPGTHSKHITLQGGQITGFKTYMTGETFKLFSTHGIFRDNVVAGELDETSMRGFEQGVRDASAAPLLHAAFKVRTNDLFERLGKEENYHYLSGLLIGTELQALSDVKDIKMYLCSGPSLHTPYSAAMRVLGLDKKVEIFLPEWEECAVVRGQAKVLNRLHS